MSKLEQLFDFLKEDPNDPFNLYAIALEYEKSDLHKAREFYDRLLAEHPGYTATYYMAGKLYESLKDKEKAEEIYRKGMSITRDIGKNKAYSELQNALNIMMDEEY